MGGRHVLPDRLLDVLREGPEGDGHATGQGASSVAVTDVGVEDMTRDEQAIVADGGYIAGHSHGIVEMLGLT